MTRSHDAIEVVRPDEEATTDEVLATFHALPTLTFEKHRCAQNARARPPNRATSRRSPRERRDAHVTCT